MSRKKAFIALAIITAFGALGTAYAEVPSDDPETGFVIPGSKAGVNPAYHPWYFGSPPNRRCFERFETYDLASGTYLGYDGRRHPCSVQSERKSSAKKR
jgi:hypothetical protein